MFRSDPSTGYATPGGGGTSAPQVGPVVRLGVSIMAVVRLQARRIQLGQSVLRVPMLLAGRTSRPPAVGVGDDALVVSRCANPAHRSARQTVPSDYLAGPAGTGDLAVVVATCSLKHGLPVG